ncbi:hypothetical protein DM860_010600 [Cuscuta australis]|uniref:Uncharacterized protein n=1 Tax=Cuscuta australis TaxID=267555 RepID=A0A328E1L8_9ASTE|nr:hypothetical protein DM860_010600 [Cuscuta australis]
MKKEEEEERMMEQEQLILTPPGYPRMESPLDKNNNNPSHRERGVEDHSWCVTAM